MTTSQTSSKKAFASDPKLPIGSNFCKCAACGEYFGGVRAFELHRITVKPKWQDHCTDKQHQQLDSSDSKQIDVSKSTAKDSGASDAQKADTAQHIAGSTTQKDCLKQWEGVRGNRSCTPPSGVTDKQNRPLLRLNSRGYWVRAYG